MLLKEAILKTLDAGQVSWYLEHFGVLGQSAEVLAQAPGVTAQALLEPMYEADVKQVCRLMGVSAVGRRGALLARLMATGAWPEQPVVEGPTFAAVDFETADYGADSACSVSLVRVENGKIVRQETRLIRPPRSSFVFTHIHGISWSQVRQQPTFAEVWPSLAPMVEGVQFIAAHNASFDRKVLEACCRTARLNAPRAPFECTVRLARKTWNLFPTKLPDVCRHLGIPLRHHDAASDAHACARIVLAAVNLREFAVK